MKRRYIGSATLALVAVVGLWMTDSSQVSVAAIGDGGISVAYTGPYGTPEVEGRKLWLKLNCSGCHGAHDEGGMGPSIRSRAYDVGSAVLEGRELGMPKFLGVSQADIKNLTAYLLSVQAGTDPKFTQWWVDKPAY